MNEIPQSPFKGGNKKGEEAKVVSTLEGVVCTDFGDPLAPVYKRIYDEDVKGTIVKKVDETNLFEFIQASRSTTDLATLQKRFIEFGEIPNVDPSLVYDETAVFPSDIHGVYEMVNNVADNFNKLPDTAKKVFGDKETYLKCLLDGSAQSLLTAAYGQQVPKQDETETKGENE